MDLVWGYSFRIHQEVRTQLRLTKQKEKENKSE